MSFFGPEPEWDGKLSAYDFFSMPVVLAWEDGSICSFQHAFYRYEGSSLVVYTEHCMYHAFDKHTKILTGDDRSRFSSYEEWRVNVEDLEWRKSYYGF